MARKAAVKLRAALQPHYFLCSAAKRSTARQSEAAEVIERDLVSEWHAASLAIDLRSFLQSK